MSSTRYGPDETWPTHSKKYWANPLRLARDAGWTLNYLGSAHKFGMAQCPAGEHTFSVDSTARGAETKAIEAKKLINRCDHSAPAYEQPEIEDRQKHCETLLTRAEQLIAVAAEDRCWSGPIGHGHRCTTSGAGWQHTRRTGNPDGRILLELANTAG